MKSIKLAFLTALCAALLLCGCGAKEAEDPQAPAEPQETAEEQIPFTPPASLAQGSNAINNIYCAGLAYDAGDTCYYVKEDENGSGCGTLRAKGPDGDTLLYTSQGNIEYLTATTEKVYFVVTLYKANGHFKEDVFCSYDLFENTVTEHFTCSDRVIALTVNKSGIYLCTTAERNGSKILHTDGAGREPQVLWEQADIISDCTFSGDTILYISNNRLWQSDLGGENKRELCSSLYMLGSPMMVGEAVYFTNYDSYLCPTLNRLNSDGTLTPIVSYGENIRISAVNLYANQLYLVKSTVDVEGNTQSAAIEVLFTDGSGETTLYEGDTEIYGLTIADNKIHCYDLAAGKALQLPLTLQ
ncbi:MAG: DUF5050 domain-containing protein [Firmicutes bacterium]|nr:DUF5050 domain-containing protein [Bacillota bacterium]